MATSTRGHLLSKGIRGLLQGAYLEHKCTNTILVRYRHATSAGSIVQEDSKTRPETFRSSHFQEKVDRSTSMHPFFATPSHHTHLSRTLDGCQSLLFRRTIVTNHHFNTNKTVSKLEKKGFQRGQAEGIMRSMKAFIRQHTNRIRKNMLTKSDLENETYLFKAALTELRTELQILRKNDAAALAIRTEIISREIDSLNQKLREDIATVKSDIAIDMNSRKSDVREEQKALEIRIQSMSNHYMAQLGGVRTQMEAAKWETIRKGMMSIFGAATFVLLTTRLFMKDEDVPEDYIDPYVNHSNAQHNNDGLVPDSFVVSHRS